MLNLVAYCMLYTIRYLVFGIQIVGLNTTIHIWHLYFLNTEQYLVFGIQIFSMTNIIEYLVFGDF